LKNLKFAHQYKTTPKALNLHMVFVAALLLSACGGEEFADLQEFVKNSGADLRGKVPAAPEIKPYEPFPYDNSAGLPDPFKARKPDKKDARNGGQNQPDVTRAKQELEEYPLDSLKMVGSLRKGKVANAIIRNSEGKIYRVKAGNYIGMNFGQVTSITETEVIIKEMVQDGAGDWLERESSLQLVE
jgi:type IV pilus assembly protein PilP